MTQPLRIACYGPISDELGSVAGANLLVVRELVAAGNTVQLFYFDRVSPPPDLAASPNFSYEELRAPAIERFFERLLLRRWSLTKAALLATFFLPFRKASLRTALRKAGLRSQFNVLLFLGYPAYCRLPGTTTVAWYQSPLQTELQGIRNAREHIVASAGWLKYLKLDIGYVLRLAAIRLFCEPSDVVIASSEWTKREVMRWHLPPKRIEVVPYPIDLSLFRPLRRSVKSANSGPTFLWLGRANPRKRLDLMVGAFELFVTKHGAAKLIFVGGFSYLPEQQRLLQNSTAREFISYRSSVPRNEIPALLSEVDVLVQPSEMENFGSSVAEAIASGVPVVVGPTNGTGEYVADCGFVFEEYTPISICRAMERAVASEVLPSRARELAETYFDPAKVAHRLATIVSSAALAPSHSAPGE